MKLKKLILLMASTLFLLFTSCIVEPLPDDPADNSGGTKTESTDKKSETTDKDSDKETEKEPEKTTKKYADDLNPKINDKASVSQDFIFNTDSVGFTTITIRRSEWNKMLTYFDYFYKNENLVTAESYEYSKNGKEWKLNTVGIRLRGNTSRFRPQGKDTPTDETGHRQMNADWSTDYYNYAATCDDNDYRQSHFKIDFEPFDDDDRKMSDCMKGVALKRSDSLFSSEIFCYKLFHLYGIWTAPRASQTKVYIKFVEDVQEDGTAKEDITNCEITKIDYGVYEMFEEVNKQSLKGRASKKKNNTATNAWSANDGDLWKCSGGDLSAGSNIASNFGVEQVEILNTDKPKSEWEYVWKNPCYDLKTNKSSVATATAYFQNFITELNNLSSSNAESESGISARKAFYEKWFDVDFFIKTYAVNILVGMDDDYWGNKNNYYLYFDNGASGTNKCYLIPFDYDNTLGKSISGDKVYSNPLEWGEGHDRPLLDRLLEVPEYKEKMVNALLEVSSQAEDSPWNKNKCFELWNKWFAQVGPYVATPNIPGWPNICSTSLDDNGGWKETKHYLTKDYNNIYEQVTLNFRNWLTTIEGEINFDLNGGKLDGSDDEVITVTFDKQPIFEKMIGTPKKLGYEFVGWTKTRNGTDIVTNYTGEENLTLYASWKLVPSSASIAESQFDKWVQLENNNWQNVGMTDNVSFAIEAKTDGLHISQSHDREYPRVNIKVEDLSTGKKLFLLDNIERYNGDTGDYINKPEIVYPYVEKDHVYKVTLELNNKDYNGWHELPLTVRAVGGKGDIYISYTDYTFDINTLTLTFTDFETSYVDIVDQPSNHLAPLFSNQTWGNIVHFGDYNGWSERWVLVENTTNQIQYQMMTDWSEGKSEFIALDSIPDKLFTALRYEYNDNENNLVYIMDIIIDQIYPANN